MVGRFREEAVMLVRLKISVIGVIRLFSCACLTALSDQAEVSVRVVCLCFPNPFRDRLQMSCNTNVNNQRFRNWFKLTPYVLRRSKNYSLRFEYHDCFSGFFVLKIHVLH